MTFKSAFYYSLEKSNVKVELRVKIMARLSDNIIYTKRTIIMNK